MKAIPAPQSLTISHPTGYVSTVLSPVGKGPASPEFLTAFDYACTLGDGTTVRTDSGKFVLVLTAFERGSFYRTLSTW